MKDGAGPSPGQRPPFHVGEPGTRAAPGRGAGRGGARPPGCGTPQAGGRGVCGAPARAPGLLADGSPRGQPRRKRGDPRGGPRSAAPQRWRPRNFSDLRRRRKTLNRKLATGRRVGPPAGSRSRGRSGRSPSRGRDVPAKGTRRRLALRPRGWRLSRGWVTRTLRYPCSVGVYLPNDASFC